MSKKFKSIKKGLHEAIAQAEGGAPGTHVHLPYHYLTILSLSDRLDGRLEA